MTDETKPQRRDQILQALALMLEQNRGQRITIAALARQVGVSEAALYRHFPSKARMYEGLLDFMEEALFARITRILAETPTAVERCGKIMQLVLGFAERNPGFARVMHGDVLIGETERLRHRVHQLFERLETQLKQVIRDAEFNEGQRSAIAASALANLLMCQAEGRVAQFVRSDFKRLPTAQWEDQWALIRDVMMAKEP